MTELMRLRSAWLHKGVLQLQVVPVALLPSHELPAEHVDPVLSIH